MSQITATTVRYVVPWIAGIGLAMLLLTGVALVAVVYMVASRPAPPPDQEVATVPVERTGIDVFVVPEARIFLGGQLRATASTLELDELEPGTYLLRFEADGYVPADETVRVEAGQRVKVAKQLAPVEKPPPPPPDDPQPPTGPPKIEFRSSPAGASVQVGGEVVCTTPCTWDGAEPGESYAVEMRLQGRETARGTLRDVRAGTQRFSLSLSEPAAPATLAVTLPGGGWANVYVDGKKLPKTAPFKDLPVSAGTHEIRIENPALGLDVTEKHTFVAGQTITIRAKAQ